LLACLPFLAAAYPQLTDYPSHLARYYVMLEGGGNSVLSHYYSFDWILTGNLGADLLMVPLGTLLGIERAAWLIGFLLPSLTGLAILSVEWALRRRVGIASLLAFVTIWSPSMIMGFYNFNLALVLALFAFALWVRMDGEPRRWVWFLPIGLLTWVCHVAGWGVLGVLVFGYEWHRRKALSAFLAPWPLFPPFLLLLAGDAGAAFFYGSDPVSYKIGIWFKALRDQSMRLDIATLGVLLAAIAIALRAGRFDGRLGWSALIFAALTIIMPRHLGGGDYADWRLIPVVLMTGCLAIDWRAPRLVLYAVAAFFLVRLAVTTSAWHESDRQLQASLDALDEIPNGARVAGAVVVPLSQWASDPFEHAPSYATVRRDALVNSHFAVKGVHMLQLREAGDDFVDPSQRIVWREGETIDLADFEPAHQADSLWYFGTRKPDRLPDGAEIIHRTPNSFLARLANHEGGR